MTGSSNIQSPEQLQAREGFLTFEGPKKAAVKAAFLSRAGWKIHKNALGVTQRRTLPGYVLFKVSGEPSCQLRPYTLTEQYVGAGKFQKAAGVNIGYVRFQDC